MKLVITVLVLLICMVSTTVVVNKEKFKETVIETLNECHQTVYEFRDKINGKDVVILLGSTKSGKSTLINYLIGTKLLAYDSGITGLKIKEHGESVGPIIGQSSLSTTTTPGIYVMQGISNTVLIDSPGFDDNRGVVQNLINAIFINQIKYAKTVKFAMVTDMQEISSDNINNFLRSLEQMNELLSGCDKMLPHVSIIFTKVPSECHQECVSNLLKKQVLNDKLKVCKALVSNVVNNNNLLGILNIPLKEGVIDTKFDTNIEDAIEASDPINMEDFKVTFTVSDQTREALLEVYPKYTDSEYFKVELVKVLKEFNNFFKDKWIFASYDDELDNASKILTKTKLNVEQQRIIVFDDLGKILRSLEILLGNSLSHDFAADFEFAVLLDQSSIIEDQYKKIIVKNYGRSVDEVLVKLNDLLQRIEVEINYRKENHIAFPSKPSILATSYTLTRALMSKTYGITSDIYEMVADGVNNFVEKIPLKGNVASVIGTILSESSDKVPTMENICNAAEKATAVAVKYFPKGLAVGGVAGAGAGGTAAYFLYQEIYGSRFEARKIQNRTVHGWL